MARLYTTEVTCDESGCMQKVGLLSVKAPPKFVAAREYAMTTAQGWTTDGAKDYCPFHKRSKRGK